MQQLLKVRRRNHFFQYLTRYAGKGPKEGLKILYKKDYKNCIVKTYKIRNEIEEAIIEYNKEYYQQAHKIEVYNNKICNKLQLHIIRDKILKEELRRHEYDNQSIYKFLQLLKQPDSIQGKQHFQPINIKK